MIQVKVTGLRELSEVLKKLPAEIASKNGGPLAKALRKTANVFKDEAKHLAPVDAINDDGLHIRDRVVVRRDPRPGNVTERMAVKVQFKRADKVPRNYFHFVEFGTVKMAPIPFLRPAFMAKKEQALETFKVEFAKAVYAAARKAAKLRANNGR